MSAVARDTHRFSVLENIRDMILVRALFVQVKKNGLFNMVERSRVPVQISLTPYVKI